MSKEKYRPKFCRTRGCGRPFDHEGGCDGPVVETIAAGVAFNRARRRSAGQTRTRGVGQVGRAKVSRDPAVAERMAGYRLRPADRRRLAARESGVSS